LILFKSTYLIENDKAQTMYFLPDIKKAILYTGTVFKNKEIAP